MMKRVMLAVCLPACWGAQERPCLSPSGDYILARDMARAIPRFGKVPPEKILSPAPVVGGKRVFRSDEISHLASQAGAPIETGDDVCFAWPLERLNRSDVLAAMRKSLNGPGGDPAATIEITDMTADSVPPGELEFSLGGLGRPASPDQPAPVVWHGEIRYASTRRLAVWARVRVSAPISVIVAAEKLDAAVPIRALQLRAEIKPRFPVLNSKPATIDQITGMTPLRAVPEGSEVRLENLSRPNDVNRGDLITIEALSGSVKLTFSGRAETGGRTGDVISVRNPDTKKIFQARVCAKDKAIVEPYFVKR
jgi:flagella basal body P-ring formation protein FlgA